MFCSYCNSTFNDREEQMSHYKTDWHRFNLKQKPRSARHVSAEEFEEMTGITSVFDYKIVIGLILYFIVICHITFKES